MNDTAINRLYFLVPNTEAARTVTDVLFRELGFDERRVHVVARAEADLEALPEATPDEASDFAPALKRGAAAGGVAGLLAGVTAISFPPAGLTLGGGALLALTGLGSAFGATVSALVGASTPHTEIEDFQEAVDAGQILMLIDVQPEEVSAVRARVSRVLPNAAFRGTNVERPGVFTSVA